MGVGFEVHSFTLLPVLVLSAYECGRNVTSQLPDPAAMPSLYIAVYSPPWWSLRSGTIS